MQSTELRTWKQFVDGYLSNFIVVAEKDKEPEEEKCSFQYKDIDKLLRNRIKQLGLKEIDIIIFLNCVHYQFTYKEVAKGLGISIWSVRYRLSKVKKRFPELRIFNKNLPINKPRRFSRTNGERGYSGPNIEISGIEHFNQDLPGMFPGDRIKKIF